MPLNRYNLIEKVKLQMKKPMIITGHYGSGKTNLAVNLAVKAAESNEKVTVVDLDIVNPYFRTADFAELFAKKGITLVVSGYANSNLDIPSISYDINHINTDGTLIIDVGGDDAGATALGRFSTEFRKRSYEMIYVINSYRYLTHTPMEALELMYEIEESAKLRHTAIVNNSNLGCETSWETVKNSLDFAETVAKKSGLPLLYSTCPEGIVNENSGGEIFPVKIYVKPVWAK